MRYTKYSDNLMINLIYLVVLMLIATATFLHMMVRFVIQMYLYTI